MAYVKRERKKVKKCKLCRDNVEYIDYKDVRKLKEFMNDKGKILPKRINGNCAKHQRMVRTAIHRARKMMLVSYVNEWGDNSHLKYNR